MTSVDESKTNVNRGLLLKAPSFANYVEQGQSDSLSQANAGERHSTNRNKNLRRYKTFDAVQEVLPSSREGLSVQRCFWSSVNIN